MATLKSESTPHDWEAEAKRVLKAELARAGVSHKVLVARFEAMGIEDTVGGVSSRIARGTFSFAFFLQCMRALGVEDVRVGERRAAR